MMNLKPGDVFNGVDCFNHIVDEVVLYWSPIDLRHMISDKTEKNLSCLKTNPNCWCSAHFGRGVSGNYISEICVHTTSGMTHWASEKGVNDRSWSAEKIISYIGNKGFNKYVELGLVSEVGTRLRFETREEYEIIKSIKEQQ